MRIHRRRRGGYQKKPETVNYRSNDQIRSSEVRVVDEAGVALGVLRTEEAIALAQERGFDVVEVSPKAVPPVCRFLDYGQFKYQKEKELRAQKAHAKKVEVKGVRLSVKMGQNDFNTRLEQAYGFLESGDKLKIELRLRGREKAHGDIAKEKVQEFINSLEEKYPLVVEQAITRSGGTVSAVVGRKS